MEHDDWYRHYGLERDPFAQSGVQGLFYPGAARQEIVDQLQHLARFGDSVLLVLGLPGAGKSATLAHCVAQCAQDTRCAVVEVALLDGPEQILRRVLEGFGLAAEPGARLEQELQRLEAFCEECRSAHTLTWLALDDAQHLHEAALGLLKSLLERSAGRLRLLLFAEPGWREVLRPALPAAASVHVIELNPLDRDECHAYIHYRLKTAGLESEPPLTAAELDEIHRQSAGLPGRIDVHARQALIELLGTVQQPLSTLPLWHFGVVAATLLALALLYVWSAFDAAPPAMPQPVPGPVHATLREEEPEPVLVAEEPPAAGAVEAAEPALEAPPIDALPEEAAPMETAAVPVAPVSAPPGEPEPPAAVPEAPAPPAVPANVASGAPHAAQAATEVPPPAPAQSGLPQAAQDVPGASDDEQYLLALDPSVYVLQLASGDEVRRLRRFAASLSVPPRLHAKLHQGSTWYALVHGEYRDRAAAEQAARELAARMPGTQPWVRQAGAVQREIREARAR